MTNNVFRIKERFKITGVGVIYCLEKPEGAIIKLGDILTDLRGNRFKVKGIEMYRRVHDYKFNENRMIGLLIECVDGVEASGNILVRNTKEISFIFCNNLLSQGEVDDEYKEEYDAAKLKHPCALFSYEDLENGRLNLYGKSISGLAIYRGWMMSIELYEKFYSLLEQRGIILINTPDEYKKYHLLPEWYNDFEKETIESVWETEGSIENALKIAKTLEGAYIVKDYVKSRKHEWYDACFIKDINNKNIAEKVIANFVNRQGSSLVGGIVLRKYKKFLQIGFHEKSGMPLSEEYRVFIYAGQILKISNYWMGEYDHKLSNEEQKWIEEIARKVKSSFVTVDIARCEDGFLTIVEFGDAQVSGIQQISASDFYDAFKKTKF